MDAEPEMNTRTSPTSSEQSSRVRGQPELQVDNDINPPKKISTTATRVTPLGDNEILKGREGGETSSSRTNAVIATRTSSHSTEPPDDDLNSPINPSTLSETNDSGQEIGGKDKPAAEKKKKSGREVDGINDPYSLYYVELADGKNCTEIESTAVVDSARMKAYFAAQEEAFAKAAAEEEQRIVYFSAQEEAFAKATAEEEKKIIAASPRSLKTQQDLVDVGGDGDAPASEAEFAASFFGSSSFKPTSVNHQAGQERVPIPNAATKEAQFAAQFFGGAPAFGKASEAQFARSFFAPSGAENEVMVAEPKTPPPLKAKDPIPKEPARQISPVQQKPVSTSSDEHAAAVTPKAKSSQPDISAYENNSEYGHHSGLDPGVVAMFHNTIIQRLLIAPTQLRRDSMNTKTLLSTMDLILSKFTLKSRAKKRLLASTFKGLTTLDRCCFFGDYEAIQFLAQLVDGDLSFIWRGAKILPHWMLLVSRDGKPEDVTNMLELLYANCDINITIHDDIGSNGLLLAVFYGNTYAIEWFISNGAELDHRLGGDTSLHIAVRKRHAEVVRLLLRAGASVSVEDGDGKRPIFDTCTSDGVDVSLLAVFLEFGVFFTKEELAKAVDIVKSLEREQFKADLQNTFAEFLNRNLK